MNEKIEFRCPKCGKLLDSITLDYRLKWLCSKCAEDQSDVLHCERGCKVKAVDLDAGLSCDSKQAHELLTEGQVYEVEKIHVGGWCSSIRLKEFPGKEFNTVHFIRYELGGNMETVEILAGGEFANAVKSLGLTSAVCAYHYQPQPTHWREEYQVWLLSKEDFDNICAIDNDDWKDDWGWWRHAYGSNLGTVDCAYIINGEKLMAWDGLQRKEWCQDCSDCAGTEKDKDECFHDHQYPDILIYLCDEIGASTERNVCACTIDLARQNNLTLAELFKKYLG